MRSRGAIRGAFGCARGPRGCQFPSSKPYGRGILPDTHEWKTAVTTNSDLGLVRVDKDLGVASRTLASFTSHDPLVRPPHRLLVNHLHRALRLRLCNVSALVRSLSFHGSVPYLKIEVRLLEPRACHGLRPWLLTPRPDTNPVWCLVDLGGLGLIHRCRSRLAAALRCAGDGSFEVAGRGSKGAVRDAQSACHGARRPQLSCCHDREGC